MTIEALIASFGLINLLALGGVVLIGLPHGAFDGAIAACLGQANRPVAMIVSSSLCGAGWPCCRIVAGLSCGFAGRVSGHQHCPFWSW